MGSPTAPSLRCGRQTLSPLNQKTPSQGEISLPHLVRYRILVRSNNANLQGLPLPCSKFDYRRGLRKDQKEPDCHHRPMKIPRSKYCLSEYTCIERIIPDFDSILESRFQELACAPARPDGSPADDHLQLYIGYVCRRCSYLRLTTHTKAIRNLSSPLFSLVNNGTIKESIEGYAVLKESRLRIGFCEFAGIPFTPPP